LRERLRGPKDFDDVTPVDEELFSIALNPDV
jgi:hypothetical protein